MNPIPLSSPTGAVYAYACGRCHHVGSSGSMLWREAIDGPITNLVESSQGRAAECCKCHDCGSVLEGQIRLCEECLRWLRFRQVWNEIGFCYQKGFDEAAWKAWLRSDDED